MKKLILLFTCALFFVFVMNAQINVSGDAQFNCNSVYGTNGSGEYSNTTYTYQNYTTHRWSKTGWQIINCGGTNWCLQYDWGGGWYTVSTVNGGTTTNPPSFCWSTNVTCGTPTLSGPDVAPAPEINCPGNQIVNTSNSTCDAIVNYTATLTGAQTTDITYTFSGSTLGSGNGDGSGSTFSKGTTTVTLTATKSCATVSCSFDVVVKDNILPTINCVALDPVQTDAGTLTATLADYTLQINYSDNCPFSTGFVKVSAGQNHTLAIGPDGSLWAWGYGGSGALGNGTTVNVFTPQQVGTDTDWLTIEAGSYSSHAIKSDGTLWAWGNNDYGQLGDGTNTSRLVPTQIGTATNWKSLAKSYSGSTWNHSLGLRTDGTLWAWGWNAYGQLGIGTSTDVNIPTQVGTSTDWASIDAGQGFSYGLKTDGSLYAWGANNYSELGTGNRYTFEYIPKKIGTASWSSVKAGRSHGVGIQSDGTLWTWGLNQHGQLGNGAGWGIGVAVNIPTQINESTDWVIISAGWYNNMALKSNGALWVWGNNENGQNGPLYTLQSNTLYQFGTDTDWVTIEAGAGFNTVFKTDGSLWAWGYNGYGQLGTATAGNGIPGLVVAPVFSAVTQSPSPGTLLPLGDNTITFSVTDASGNSNSCTQVVKVVGPAEALAFDGTNDYVALNMFESGANSLPEFTVEAWVNTSFNIGNNFSNWSILDFDRSEFFNVFITPMGQLGFGTSANGTTINDMFSENELLNDGLWHHIAAVYDGKDKILYHDGVEIARVVNAHGGVALGNAVTRYAFIGDSSEATTFNGSRNGIYYDGQIDEVRYWNVALCEEAIQSQMNNELTGSEAGLTAYYNFNQGYDSVDNAGLTTLPDVSGNNHTGTLFNSTLNGSTSNWIASGGVVTGSLNNVVIVCNVAPIAVCKELSVSADTNCQGTAIAAEFNDGSSDPDGDDITYSLSPVGPYAIGETEVILTVTDPSGLTSTCITKITVTDDLSPVLAGCPDNISQGNDAGICGAKVIWTEPTASDNCTLSGDLVWTKSHEPGDTFNLGTTTVTYTTTDVAGNTSLTCSFDVTVTNILPVNNDGIVASSIDPIQAGTGFSLSANFNDDNLTSATWYFSNDGEINGPGDAELTFAGTISGGVVSNAFNFDASLTGVYAVKVVVVDACGETAEASYHYIVVYDPSGGFVTGGGWINSPNGALIGTTTSGTANFGFVAKYKSGKNTAYEVDGNTNFQFKEGNFHFKSASHKAMSLVISGDRKATYNGSGTVNGTGAYDFMVSVIDGEAPGAGPYDYDSFRIKVWHSGSPANVVYDNEFSLPENADAVTGLGGGSIVIHKPKGGKSSSRETDSKTDTSKENSFEGFKLAVWPNPSKDAFRLKLNSSNSIDAIEIQVYDLNGRRVYSQVGSANQEYQIGNAFQSGLYFVNVIQGKESQQVKLIKY